MIEIVWFRGADRDYRRSLCGSFILPLTDDFRSICNAYQRHRLVQAADQPEYIRWPQ